MLRFAAIAVLLAAGGALLWSPTAGASSSMPVVISQAYGGGGNAGAVYAHDFVELHNAGSGNVELAGFALEYASATGSSWSVLPLSGTMQGGGYFLIQLASSGAVGAALPTPDLASNSINIGRSAGKLALVPTTSALTVACPLAVADVTDFLGYGTTANCYEGTGPAPEPQPLNQGADLRAGAGCTDTDDNSTDFASAPVLPRSSATPARFCVPDDPPGVVATVPADGATEVSVSSDVTVRFTEAVQAGEAAFAIDCSSSGAHPVAVESGDSVAFTLDPAGEFTPGERCTLTVSAARISDADAVDPPDTMTADYVAGFQVGVGPPARYLVTVDDASPIAGATVTVRAQLADAVGNPLAQEERTVLWSSSGADGALSADSTETDASGVATVELATSRLAGTVHAVTATDAGDGSLTGTSPTFTTVAGPATHLAFTSSGDALASGSDRVVSAELRDENDNVTADGPSEVTFSKTAGDGSVTGLGAATVSSGVASTTVTGKKAGQVTIAAVTAGLAVDSTTFDVVPGPAARLVFTTASKSMPFGSEAPLSVGVRDANQNLVVGDTGREISLIQTGGTGTLGGLRTLVTSAGAASTTLTGSASGTITLAIAATGLEGAATSFPVLAADGSGALTTPVVRVANGSAGNAVAFTYRAAIGGLSNGTITIDVPSGWSEPSTEGPSPGFVRASAGSISISSRTIVVSQVTLGGGDRLQIVYGSTASGGPGATAPGMGGPQSWTAASKAEPGGRFVLLAASPSINVLAADGSGALTTRTSIVKPGASALTLTFTYSAAEGGIFDGAVRLVVPAGWSAPSTDPSTPGYVTVRGGTVSVDGRDVIATGLAVGAGQTVGIVYGSKAGGGPGASAPKDPAGTQLWTASSRASSAGAMVPLSASPGVAVMR